MNFRSFSKGDLFLALPTFSNSVLLFVELRWRGVTCVCVTGSPCLWGLRISLKLMGASRFLPRWGHCYASGPALFSSCRELGNGDLYNPSPPHLQELQFSIWSSSSCQGEEGTWHLRQIVKFPHYPLFIPPNLSRLAHTPSNCLY